MPFTNKNALWIFYLLAFYILIQTLWWGYHIIQLSQLVHSLQVSGMATPSRYVHPPVHQWMVFGEGFVFLLLLGVGFWQLQKYVKKELTLAQMEKTFLLSMTHEIKTPIAALRLLSETALKHDLEKSQMHSIMKQTLEETDRLQLLTENVLLATRLDQRGKGLTFENVDLSEIVHHLPDRFSSGQDRIRLEAPAPALISGDEQLIGMLTSNLVDNALKYSPPSDPVFVRVTLNEEYVALSVSDTGPGIPAKHRQRAFEKFQRLDTGNVRFQPGTGLGLYLARNIARLHKAEISIGEILPHGTVVTVKFQKK